MSPPQVVQTSVRGAFLEVHGVDFTYEDHVTFVDPDQGVPGILAGWLNPYAAP